MNRVADSFSEHGGNGVVKMAVVSLVVGSFFNIEKRATVLRSDKCATVCRILDGGCFALHVQNLLDFD